MKNVKFKLSVFAICILGSAALASSGGRYILEWNSIDGGGGVSTGGKYTLNGTIGQPDAGYLSGGQYYLEGGFQTGGALCFVNFEDFGKLAEYWLTNGSNLPADLVPDGIINADDLAELANWWLTPCPYGWPLK